MARRFIDTHVLVLVLAFVALSGAGALALIYSRGYTHGDPPIRSDGVGYYIYLPAVFLDHDLSLVRTVHRSFGGDLQKAGDLRRVEHGGSRPRPRRAAMDARSASSFGARRANQRSSTEPSSASPRMP